jgi:anthranilate synthase component 1
MARSAEFAEVLELARSYNLVPVVRTLMADMETPIRVFRHFYRDDNAFLLESVEGGAKWGRYSYIGTDPFLIVRGKKGRMVMEMGGRVTEIAGKPVELIKSVMQSYRSPQLAGLPPFTGGAIGYFGYDLVQMYENLPPHASDDLGMDDVHFLFCDQVIVFDHFKQQIHVIANVHAEPGADEAAIRRNYEKALGKIRALTDRLRQPLPPDPAIAGSMPEDADIGDFASNMTREAFIGKVEKAKEYIRAGDIFQVVLSQRFHLETDVSPLDVYRVLRTLNPSPYLYCLKMGEETIVGASPELLVKVDGDRVETRPIAGTRPRGATPEEDVRLERELLADEKELAEHLMLVDLGRNDIGRVAEYGSVQCDSFMEIERYSHVMHIVSNVSGKLRGDRDFFDALLACLPAGTVSGAPKIRAMEIIAELEPEARGVYAGAIGYLGFAGTLNTCITIRTAVFKDGKAYVQAGAGIVFDSVPENEYAETVNKAKGMLKAIRIAESMFRPQTGPVRDAINHDYVTKR